MCSSQKPNRLQAPRVVVLLHTVVPQGGQGHHDLVGHVRLVLLHRAVADPHGPRVLVPAQVLELVLGEIAPPVHAVHDLQLVGVPGHGAQQPVMPQQGAVAVPALHEDLDDQGGVPQPREAVVPVAFTPEVLGQARGGRGDDPPGLRVGQRTQHEQRTRDGAPVVTGAFHGGGPVHPELVGGPLGTSRVRGDEQFPVGLAPREHPVQSLPLVQGERPAVPGAQPLQGADVRPGSVCLTVGDLHLLVVPTELVRLQGGFRQQQGARAGHGQQPLAHGLARLGVVSGVVDPVAEPAVPTRRARRTRPRPRGRRGHDDGARRARPPRAPRCCGTVRPRCPPGGGGTGNRPSSRDRPRRRDCPGPPGAPTG